MKSRFVVVLALAAAGLAGQDDQGEVRTRQLWDLNLQHKRAEEAGTTPKHAAPKKPVHHPSLKPVLDAYIGVTVWRFRPSRSQDAPAARMLLYEPNGKKEDWTPERSTAGSPFQVGQRVRLSIESAREGYLYVIDREQYGDGTFGQAMMIFPALNMRHSDNRVRAGRVVDIPATLDGFFKVTRNRKDQMADELTILVSPEPLPNVKITEEAQPIPEKQLVEWKKNWGTAVKQLDEHGQAGKTYTTAERAASDKGALLAATDPLPQTMFEVQAPPDKPMIVTLALRIE